MLAAAPGGGGGGGHTLISTTSPLPMPPPPPAHTIVSTRSAFSGRDLSWLTWDCWYVIFREAYGPPGDDDYLQLASEPPEDYTPPAGQFAQPGGRHTHTCTCMPSPSCPSAKLWSAGFTFVLSLSRHTTEEGGPAESRAHRCCLFAESGEDVWKGCLLVCVLQGWCCPHICVVWWAVLQGN
jgi:hypothetical protein